ncbi:MAG: YeeE/YedE family protein [Rhizobiales bacterium]|nr:YeeE/YedE family protein [Hyphomicrobiales bacterium]
MLALSAFAAGLLFGLGLIVSQMVNPAKVLAFLDVTGSWDPSLAFVMVGATAASAIGYAVANSRGIPVLGDRLEIPNRRDFDARLIGGAALFGIGWGLVGLCPGPAVVMLPFGLWQGSAFVVAMLAGMGLFAALRSAKAGSSSREVGV